MATDRATLGINTKPFRRGLEEARMAAGAFGGKLKAEFAGIGAQIAAAFTIGFAVNFFNTVRNELDRIGKLAQRFNESAESIQRVDQAASLAGSNIEQVATGMVKATRAAVEATQGVATYTDAFDALGINAEKFIGMGIEEKMLTLSRAYVDSGKSGTALANIVQLLGRSGAEMIPLLAGGPEALQAAFDDATVASNESVDAIQKVNDSLTRTGTALKTSLAPAFIFFGKVAATTINGIMIGAKTLGGMVAATAIAIKEVATGNFKEAGRVLDDFSKAAYRTNKALIDQTADIWKTPEDSPGAVSVEQAEAEVELLGKIQTLREKVNDAERKAAFEKLGLEEKLLRIRMDAAKATQTAGGTNEEAALNARLELVELAKQEQQILEQIERQEQGIASQREQLAAREAKFAEDRKSDADKLFSARQRIADLEMDLQNTDIEEEKIRMQMELLDLKDAELQLADSLAEKEKQRMEEIRKQAESEVEREMKDLGIGAVGSLRSIGGGGGVSVADPSKAMQTEQQKGNAILQRIEDILKTQGQEAEI